MTVAVFANKMGVSQASASKWINGRQVPRLKMIERMAEILEVPLHELWLDNSSEAMQDMYEVRLRKLIATQPEHVKAKILAMVAEELAKREKTSK